MFPKILIFYLYVMHITVTRPSASCWMNRREEKHSQTVCASTVINILHLSEQLCSLHLSLLKRSKHCCECVSEGVTLNLTSFSFLSAPLFSSCGKSWECYGGSRFILVYFYSMFFGGGGGGGGSARLPLSAISSKSSMLFIIIK